jgi:hypothetical protein
MSTSGAVGAEVTTTGNGWEEKAVSWHVDPTRSTWNNGSCAEPGLEQWTNE